MSGVASIGLVSMILRTVENPSSSSAQQIALFACLCGIVLATRIVSQILVSRLKQTSIINLQMGLCRRILAAPIKDLEEIGAPRLLAALTNDVSAISVALTGVPGLAINLVILVAGAVYLGYLSIGLLCAAAFFCVLGVCSYWYSAAFAGRYAKRAREQQNVLFERIEELIDGVKVLKMHHARRHEFVETVLQGAETAAQRSQMTADCLFDAAVSWGRLAFFIAIGLLLFAWPRISHVDAPTLTGYVLVILYLMSPLEQIMVWVPHMNWANEAVRQIERLGLMLDHSEPDAPVVEPDPEWEQIEFLGVTHTYHREGQPKGFVLGPFHLTIVPGEIVFVIGGNGSGKTTLAKLLTGLYLPESGEIQMDGCPIEGADVERYRQHFSAVFDDAVVFANLWGIDAADRDVRAQDHLRLLQLEHLVSVTDGMFSTTALSRGQRKRLALLTAYLEDRPIYVFDEWAADQDPVFRRFFYLQLLPELKRRGKTVVAITHDDRYFATADRIIKLEEGHVVETLRHEALQEFQFETASTLAPGGRD